MIKQLVQNFSLPSGPGDKSTPIKYPDAFNNFQFKDGTLGTIVSRAVVFILLFAGVGLLLMLILGGFDFLTSAGDAKKLEQGKQKITNAILGFLIIFSAFWIVQITGRIFGLQDVIGSVFR